MANRFNYAKILAKNTITPILCPNEQGLPTHAKTNFTLLFFKTAKAATAKRLPLFIMF